MQPLAPERLEMIRSYCDGVVPLLGDMEAEFSILSYEDRVVRTVTPFLVKAPHYLVIYTHSRPKAGMNVGYVMEQIALYLVTQGIGSCFIGSPILKRKYHTLGDKEQMLVMAFGESREESTRKPVEAKRRSLEELCVYKETPRQWIKQLLEGARMAPSAMNAQPWRFVVYDNRIHIFSVKKKYEKFNRMDEINFGILFANMMTVAEELWLDVDLIRLDNISQMNFPNTEYVLSAILKS
jgi:nitroreductase